MVAVVAEADVKAGKLVSEGSKLKQLINRLSDTGGGVGVATLHIDHIEVASVQS